jgi:CheY-like chemotaxis protein
MHPLPSALPTQPEGESQLALLVADDEPSLRHLLATRARHAIDSLVVLEAEDGTEAVQIGLQQRPRFALLDVQMPRLGGIEAAITLRALHPQVRLALATAEPDAHRARAREHRLPLLDKLDVDGAIRWLERQVHSPAGRPRQSRSPQMLSLACSVCGYGAARPAPPERCPMCQGEGTWIHAPWRPFGRARALAG